MVNYSPTCCSICPYLNQPAPYGWPPVRAPTSTVAPPVDWSSLIIASCRHTPVILVRCGRRPDKGQTIPAGDPDKGHPGQRSSRSVLPYITVYWTRYLLMACANQPACRLSILPGLKTDWSDSSILVIGGYTASICMTYIWHSSQQAW